MRAISTLSWVSIGWNGRQRNLIFPLKKRSELNERIRIPVESVPIAPLRMWQPVAETVLFMTLLNSQLKHQRARLIGGGPNLLHKAAQLRLWWAKFIYSLIVDSFTKKRGRGISGQFLR